MPHVLGVACPKGGVGKTTIAVNLAALYAHHGMRVLLVDADRNRSAAMWVDGGHEHMPANLDSAETDRPRELRRLGRIQEYDLVIADLPGAAKGGEFDALMHGEDGRAVVDFLIIPTEPAAMDLRVAVPAAQRIAGAGLRYCMVFNRIEPRAPSLVAAARTREELRRHADLTITSTLVRRLVAHSDAVEALRPIYAFGGRHSHARLAEQDMRELAAEVAELAALPVTVPDLDTADRR